MERSNFSSLLSKIKEFPFLHSVQISLTNRCNEDCIHCFVCKKYHYELNTQKLKDIISKLRKLNCMEVIFTGGEAMLRKDFFEILNFTKEKGIGIKIMSNGTLITTTNIKYLRKILPINIQISLYGATSKTHDYTTRLQGSFGMATNALRLLEMMQFPLLLLLRLCAIIFAKYPG